MIKDLGELQKLLKLCRKQGVTEITLGNVIIKFGDLPQEMNSEEASAETEEVSGADQYILQQLGLAP